MYVKIKGSYTESYKNKHSTIQKDNKIKKDFISKIEIDLYLFG